MPPRKTLRDPISEWCALPKRDRLHVLSCLETIATWGSWVGTKPYAVAARVLRALSKKPKRKGGSRVR